MTRQTRAVIMSNLMSLPHRIWSSASMIAAIALVVFVLTGFLAMARGLEQSLAATGATDVAVVLGGGARQELGSEIAPGVPEALLAQADKLEITALSREMVMPVDAIRQDTGATQAISLRGMDITGPGLRRSATLTDGRMFKPDHYELVVGKAIAATYKGFKLGDTIEIGRSRWTVVGHFEAPGTVFASEIWAPLAAVQTDFGQGQLIQSLRIGLRADVSLRLLQPALSEMDGTQFLAQLEREFYSIQSGHTARLIRAFAWPLALMLAIGAGAGALNTMLGSVTSRQIEIATLRALGFSRSAAFWGTWCEAIFLASIGALLGAGLGWLVFNGFSVATMGANQNQFAFALTVSPDVIGPAVILALLIGLVGGFIPALIAARMPIAAALHRGG
ncbi:MAG: ABC transporter permease [Natronohydrobacter sp.]|nr:ABC transporter permease [Natronohydrobacter sp.]